VIPPPRGSIAVIHAYDIPYAGLRYSSLAEDEAEDTRAEYRLDAVHKIGKLFATALARARIAPGEVPSWTTHVEFGSARTVIEKVARRRDVDLLVLGTHGRSGIAHALLGTVAGDVLRGVACDALVVPPRRERSP
jgi:nucleotide-binding universal stress UspA family protein